MEPPAAPSEPPAPLRRSVAANEWIETRESEHGPDSVSISQKMPRESLVGEHAQHVERPDRTRLIATLVACAGVAGAAVLGLLAFALVGATRIDVAERAAAAADAALVRRVEQEVVVMQRPFVSDQGDEAAALFVSIRSAPSSDLRRTQARELARVLAVEARTIQQSQLPSMEAQRRSLEEAVHALMDLTNDADARQRRLVEVRESLSGRLAGLIGA